MEDVRVFTDKIARHPGVIVRDAVKPGSASSENFALALARAKRLYWATPPGVAAHTRCADKPACRQMPDACYEKGKAGTRSAFASLGLLKV